MLGIFYLLIGIVVCISCIFCILSPTTPFTVLLVLWYAYILYLRTTMEVIGIIVRHSASVRVHEVF